MPEQSNPLCRLDLYKQLNVPLPKHPGQYQPGPDVQGRCQRALGGNEGPICKRDILKQLGLPIPGESPPCEDMETVVLAMQEEVRAIQCELETVQVERRHLEMQKRLLHCAAPTITSKKEEPILPVGPPSITPTKREDSTQVSKVRHSATPQELEEEEWRELCEQYNELVQDYDSKVEEVSSLRVEVDSARKLSQASTMKSELANARMGDLEARLKAFEDEGIKGTSNKDKMIELQQQLAMAERMYEKSCVEQEDLQKKSIWQKKVTEELRKKYLNTEQCAEEQRHKIDLLERERLRFSETVNLELQKIKAQFQFKLEEMSLLPDLLDKTNEKLKEAEEERSDAEKNCIIVAGNLEEVMREKDELQKQLDKEAKNNNEGEAEKYSITSSLNVKEKNEEDTKSENKNLKVTVAHYQELAVITERKYEEELEHGAQLKQQLETLRQQSARQVAKTKEKFEKTKSILQDQVSHLEKQLASMRALERTAMKDRNSIRNMMQSQITKLNENFEEAQRRIRSIQSHVNYLKTSYTNTLGSN